MKIIYWIKRIFYGITIEVTQEHIDKGKKRNPQQCAIALAIKQELEPNTIILVGREDVYIGKNKFKQPLSRKARRFIKIFDKYEEVKPFSFKILLNE